MLEQFRTNIFPQLLTYAAALVLLFLPKKDKMFTTQPLCTALLLTVWSQDCRLMASVVRTVHCGQH